MTQNSSFVYDALLNGETTPAVQRRVLNYAAHNKDIRLLIRLCQLANLDTEIDAELGKRTEADVLASWASRPGRSTEELIGRFSKEKRATLLAQLAERSDLPDALYNELALHSSASVGTAILANPKAPETARVNAAQNALRSIRSSWSTPSRIAEMFRDTPAAAADAAVETAPSLMHLQGLVKTVTVEKQNAVVRRMMEIIVKDIDEVDYSTRSATDAIWGALGTEARTSFVAEILAKHQDGSLPFVRQTEFLKEITTRPIVNPIEKSLDFLSTGTDEAELGAALRQVCGSGDYFQRREAFRRAVLNENVSVDAIMSNISNGEREDVVSFAKRVVDNDEYLLTLLEMYGGRVLPVMIEAGRDVKSFIRKFAKGTDTPLWVKQLPMVERDPEFALEVLGARDVIESPYWSKAARELLLDRLGEDNTRWELLERLIGEWSGSLPTLLDSIENL